MRNYFERKFVISGIFITVILVFVIRLFYMQVIDKSYWMSANNNVLRREMIYPGRGVIYDRNGKVLVRNTSVYDLMVVPRETKDIDTALLCQLIDIDVAGYHTRIAQAKKFSPYRASIFEKQLSVKTYAKLQEHLYELPGFYVQHRTARKYPAPVAPQLLGFIQEVNERDIARSEGFYRSSDYIGATGIERSYETLLRGKRGITNTLVDVLNRPKGSFMDGKYDTLAVSGEGLIATIDRDLQQLAEKLMSRKKGAVVAIEPATGEILTYVKATKGSESAFI